MFTAILFACHALLTDQCMQLTDDRGPYRTERECEVRVMEMIDDTVRIWKQYDAPVLIQGYKCEKGQTNVSAT